MSTFQSVVEEEEKYALQAYVQGYLSELNMEWFASPVWSGVARIIRREKPTSLTALAGQLANHGQEAALATELYEPIQFDAGIIGSLEARAMRRALSLAADQVKGIALQGTGDLRGAVNDILEQVWDLSGRSRAWKWHTLKDAYEPRPAVGYAVQGLFEIPSLNIVYGAPGSFKSFLLADLAICIAANEDWLPPLPGETVNARKTFLNAVAWLDFDNGARRTHERFEALGKARALSPSIPLEYVVMPHPWLDATRADSMAMLAEQIKSMMAKVVFIDNLGVVSGGADENSGDMIQVMSAFRRLSEETGAAVTLIHHETKLNTKSRAGYRLRGHTSIEASLDLALLVERDDGHEPRATVQSTKSRGVDVAPFGVEFTFENDTMGAGPVVMMGAKMAAARFFGCAVDASGETKVRNAIKDVVKDFPNVAKTELARKARSRLGNEVGLNQVRGIITDMADDGELVESDGAHGAKCYNLP